MLNAVASRAAKEHGQQIALSFAGDDWRDRVLDELRAWCATRSGDTMTLEEFRADAKNQPKSHKAWGALPAVACRAGLLAPMTHPDGSPVMKPAQSVRTHGHYVRVWAIVSSFSVTADGQRYPSLHGDAGAAASRQPGATAGVGHPGSAIQGDLQ